MKIIWQYRLFLSNLALPGHLMIKMTSEELSSEFGKKTSQSFMYRIKHISTLETKIIKQ